MGEFGVTKAAVVMKTDIAPSVWGTSVYGSVVLSLVQFLVSAAWAEFRGLPFQSARDSHTEVHCLTRDSSGWKRPLVGRRSLRTIDYPLAAGRQLL